VDSGGPKEPLLDGVQIRTREGLILREKKWPAQDMPDVYGGRYTQSDSTGATPVRCGCRLDVLDGANNNNNNTLATPGEYD